MSLEKEFLFTVLDFSLFQDSIVAMKMECSYNYIGKVGLLIIRDTLCTQYLDVL